MVCCYNFGSEHQLIQVHILAIHMAFDCMAIGMGLLASVMATWPPNEQFTYGYVMRLLVFCVSMLLYLCFLKYPCCAS